jgi:glycosyltransferase involved in cell wall biosynthesis
VSNRVLLISYMFPPAGGVGVQRALAMARYLPPAGLSVTVLTARHPITHVYDAALEQQIPADVRVHRTPALEPPYALRQRVKRLFGLKPAQPETAPVLAGPPPPATGLRRLAHTLVERVVFPDLQGLWVRPALQAAIRIIETEKIDSVLITLPPFSLLRFAMPLRRRFPALRIVLDFRDEWLQYHLQELQFDGPVSDWKRRHAALLEAAAVAAADHVVTVTPPWLARLRDRYPAQPAAKFLCIPNGFDPDSFRGFQRRPPPLPPMIVTYLGTLYANPVYSPQPYLDALEQMPPSWRDRIETRFIGRVAADAAPLFAGRRARILQTGFLPQREAFRQLEQSHCLLLLIGTPTVHSGKLFEATGIPILAITPRGGEVERVLRETRAGWCAAPDDPAAIGRALQEIYNCSIGQPGARPFVPDPDSVAAYSRERLTLELARASGLLDPPKTGD